MTPSRALLIAALAFTQSCQSGSDVFVDLREPPSEEPGARLLIDRRIRDLLVDGSQVAARELMVDAGTHRIALEAKRPAAPGGYHQFQDSMSCSGSIETPAGAEYELRTRSLLTPLETPTEAQIIRATRDEFLVELVDRESGDAVARLPCRGPFTCVVHYKRGKWKSVIRCPEFDPLVEKFVRKSRR